jgi:hypothetical protein
MPVEFATVSELIDYHASMAIVAWPRSTQRFTETTGRLTTNVWSICDLTETHFVSSIGPTYAMQRSSLVVTPLAWAASGAPTARRCSTR